MLIRWHLDMHDNAVVQDCQSICWKISVVQFSVLNFVAFKESLWRQSFSTEDLLEVRVELSYRIATSEEGGSISVLFGLQ
jgi:hypothetical protein